MNITHLIIFAILVVSWISYSRSCDRQKERDEMILLEAVLNLQPHATGRTIERYLREVHERNMHVGPMYRALSRLEELGFLAGRQEEYSSIPRHYTVTYAGENWLRWMQGREVAA